MAKRKIVSARQRNAARLLLRGFSGVRALREAGYGRSYSRNLGRALRRSWGLRQALREEAQAMGGWRARLRPERKRYDHRRVARSVQKWALYEEYDAPPGFAIPEVRREFADLEKRLKLSATRTQSCQLCRRHSDQLWLSVTAYGERYVCRACAGPMV